MTFFTDSTFERMMVQKPQYRREGRPPAPPKGHPCNSCTDKRSECCSCTCYRDLIIKQKVSHKEREI